jgi:hypothetical protein
MRQRTYVILLAAAIARGRMYDTQKPWWKAIGTGGASDTARHPPDDTTGRPMTEIDEDEQKERT